MTTLYHALRPLAFSVSPERAHRVVMALVRAAERLAARSALFERAVTSPRVAQDLWGLRFPNPVGLAAGFDKNAEGAHVWPALGFGFAELGTITALAQPGNPPPRLFRLPEDLALINRLGFNNAGAPAVAARLHAAGGRRPPIPIGFNIGKSRAVGIDEAAADYERSLRLLFPFADYVVVNVSSPNTPGLRDLQARDALGDLVARLCAVNAEVARQSNSLPRPLLVKISPDLDDTAIGETVNAAVRAGASGIVATNTTLSREGLRDPEDEEGGLSGAPLRARATAAIRVAYRASGGSVPIIGVGGIFTADDAYAKIRAGASLVQLYTGLVYEGPLLARRIVREIDRRLDAGGVPRLRDIVGADAR